MAASHLSDDEIRRRLVALGFDPEPVDLEWIARIKADVEASIGAFRSQAEFTAAAPLFQPERGPRGDPGGD